MMVPLFIKCLMTHLTDPLRALPLQLPHDVPFVPHVIPDHSRPALKLDLREYLRDTYMCVRGKSKRTEQRAIAESSAARRALLHLPCHPGSLVTKRGGELYKGTTNGVAVRPF